MSDKTTWQEDCKSDMDEAAKRAKDCSPAAKLADGAVEVFVLIFGIMVSVGGSVLAAWLALKVLGY